MLLSSFALIQATVQIPIPFIYSRMIDFVLPSQNMEYLFFLLALLSGFILLNTTVSFWMQVTGAKIQKKFVTGLRQAACSHILKLPLPVLKSFLSGDLTTRLTRDIDTLQNLSPHGLATLLRDLLLIIGFVSVLFVINWKLTLLSFFMTPLFFLVYPKIYDSLWINARKAHKAGGEVQAILHEKIEGAREIRLTNTFNYHMGQAGQKIEESQEILTVLKIQEAKLVTSIGIFSLLSNIILWGIGGWSVTQGWFSIGGIIAFGFALNYMFNPISRLFVLVSSLQFEVAALERVFQFFTYSSAESAEPEGINFKKDNKFAELIGQIDLARVDFSYESQKPILSGLLATILPEKVTAIVGTSGAGKTTLLSLIARLYAPSSGQILIGQIDIRDIPAEILCRWIGFVPQDVFLFHGTIRENILMGRKVMEETFQKVCQQGGVSQLADRLPHGVETLISEKGSSLSGGERQKIAIARALVEEPKVLLLDEPTNNLDEETQIRVKQGVLLAQGGKTVILVTHNLQLVKGVADTIFELHNGQLKKIAKGESLS